VGGGGGKQKVKQDVQFDPALQALYQKRLEFVEGFQREGLKGIPGMQQYISQQVVPSTLNALTASGLGRSGLVGEAVAGATLKPGLDFLMAMLTGLPGSSVATTGQTQTYKPGMFDYLQLAGGVTSGIASGICWVSRAVFGGEGFQTMLIRRWLDRHQWIRWLYAKVGPWLVPVAWAFKPLLLSICHAEMRGLHACSD